MKREVPQKHNRYCNASDPMNFTDAKSFCDVSCVNSFWACNVSKVLYNNVGGAIQKLVLLIHKDLSDLSYILWWGGGKRRQRRGRVLLASLWTFLKWPYSNFGQTTHACPKCVEYIYIYLFIYSIDLVRHSRRMGKHWSNHGQQAEISFTYRSIALRKSGVGLLGNDNSGRRISGDRRECRKATGRLVNSWIVTFRHSRTMRYVFARCQAREVGKGCVGDDVATPSWLPCPCHRYRPWQSQAVRGLCGLMDETGNENDSTGNTSTGKPVEWH